MTNTSSFLNVVGIRYGVGKRIGEGSFGTVFEGVNLLNQHHVAIKFESHKSNTPQLPNEYRAYKALVGCPGIPNAYYFGREGLHNMLVIDLLSPSLEDLFQQCKRRFTIKTVVMIAKQMLSRIQTIHEKNLIHRDIKPDNFLVGRFNTKSANTIHIVDFGMAKQYYNPKTKQHIPYKERKSITGTARYMSINTHFRREQSRRDDLEALGHVIMYFLRGSLPWQGLKAAANEQKYDNIGKMKQTTPIEDLCNGFPLEFSKYLIYVRNLDFEDTPDYDYLRGLFTQALISVGGFEDGEYDWMKPNNQIGWKAMGINPVVPQMPHFNVRQNSPTAVVIRNQSNLTHLPAEHYRLIESLTNPGVTQPVLRRNWGQAVMSQAQFQYSQSSLGQNQYYATHSHDTNAEPSQQQRGPKAEDFMQKFTNTLCCSWSRR
ncbi:hypothetical protein COCHEDRAFT_1109643 [Bipolaris maydis C5]|uniref:non-specific serine/threonine protein kinase n=1 Tax=Cochliobolus heterostrophus (strain C5 / ATCC 48332 / race O) TaxID=701091 RepID=M2ST18_COCH5|nr:hypothetical protein COCHEDRAFT_1109643 [Bipolaris maydis C5]KAJ5033274.1 kinase-like domain-containing protein [Bipolaris maydis]KAJ5051417.1 kinase-like domain-containing protein [Bipolaris maydis]KAJ6196462.1 kinase-like domain-containing protein [Bipolaris maydis]KAJ6205440.1 kinase-like domain-containing protein [Bipolaris maydis]